MSDRSSPNPSSVQNSVNSTPPQSTQHLPNAHQVFTNPFATPFAPSADGSAPMPFFFSPAQYQEMMQQYFQQMMMASSAGGQMPMNMPFPMPFMPQPCATMPTYMNHLSNDMKNASLSSGSRPDSRVDETNEAFSATTNTAFSSEPSFPTSTPAVPIEGSGEENEKEEENSRKSSQEDERTSSLIRKQMTEIDKEIVRRSQNRNIKKAALSYAPPAPAPVAVSSKETLNQLRTSFNLPSADCVPGTSTANTTTPFDVPASSNVLHNDAFASVSAMPSQMGRNFVNPFKLQPSTSPTPQPPSDSHAPLVDPAAEASRRATSVLAPPPAPSHPVQRKSSVSTTSSWPEENKENGSASGDEAVWVMRDSYLKRMQREERGGEEENWHEEEAKSSPAPELQQDENEHETDRLLLNNDNVNTGRPDSQTKKKASRETMVHEPAVLIEGVLFRARYLGSTQMLYESRSSKAARMSQAQEAVARVKAPEGEIQPSTEIDLFISTEKIMVLNTDLQRISDTDVRQDIVMDHALRSVSYIADIGDLVVLMARRLSSSSSDEQCGQADGVRKCPKVVCHVFESEEASFIAQSIGQAFQVAYVEFLRANGIDDPSYLRQVDYQEVLNSQELLGDELEMFARKETQKEVVVPKKAGEALGIVVVESGWGSMLPTVVLAHMNPAGPAARSNQLNIGDQIININGISLVGLPLSAAQTNIKNVRTATAVRFTVVSTPPVVEVRIRRPDTKYQLGFSVQNGVICSLLRGGIAERGGIRVGHRIIEINGQSVVAVSHDRIVNMLASAVGEIHLRTLPTSMYRLLTGQDVPQYI